MKRIRSLLCVPAHKPALYEKCLSYGADCIMYDLEDSVPEPKKTQALVSLRGWLASDRMHEARELITVRINPYTSDALTILDDGGRIDALVIPKVREARELLTFEHQPSFLPVIPVIETPQAIVNLEAIAKVSAAMIFGVADYAAGLGVSDRVFADEAAGAGWVSSRFAYAKQKLVTCAHAFGIQALDTCFIVKGELAGIYVRREWATSRGYGFTGAACIHPGQVEIANDIFGPTDTETRWAMRTAEGHVARGGEVGVDEHGMVVGIPVARQAAAIIKSTEVKK